MRFKTAKALLRAAERGHVLEGVLVGVDPGDGEVTLGVKVPGVHWDPLVFCGIDDWWDAGKPADGAKVKVTVRDLETLEFLRLEA